jgi:hypothetical protein
MRQTMFQQTDGAHLVVHCGLGIGLAAGKCCAERIREQGGDFSLQLMGNGVVFKAAARSALKISNPGNDVLPARDKKSQRKHLPAWPGLSQSK